MKRMKTASYLPMQVAYPILLDKDDDDEERDNVPSYLRRYKIFTKDNDEEPSSVYPQYECD